MNFKATALVSIYNSEEFIIHKIENLKRSKAPIKIILVDCTGGRELELIRSITKAPKFVKIIHNDRISLWKAINNAIKIADTPYVVMANTDDLVHPNAYLKQIEKLDEGYDISYFDYYLTDGHYNDWSNGVEKAYDKYFTPDNGYKLGYGLGPFPMWRKSLHDKVGYFDDNLEILADCLFWDKLASMPVKWCRIPEFLGVCARRKCANLENNNKLMVRDKKYLRSLNDEE